MNIVWNAFWGNLNIEAASPPDAGLNGRFVFHIFYRSSGSRYKPG